MPDRDEAPALDPGLRVRKVDGLPGRLSSVPILLLHVHENCNCRCVMCDIWQREGGREIDLEWLEAKKAGQNQLSLSGMRAGR